jgi:tetratricopeptide (TPR) repeat protein
LGNSERLASHASAYSNRGAVKTAAPGHGALAAIADYDAAITIREGLREAPGNDWPAAWRNGLANAYMHRGNAKMFVPGCGALAAIADYDAAIVLMEHLRDSLGERWPVPWRNHLAGAYVNRGIAELDAPGHGALAAIADYDAAIAIMEGLREALGKKWPQRWRNRLAVTYMSRGNAKVNASRYGALAAIADYDTAIRTMESLREMLGEDWPVPWRNELAGAYMNRGNAKMFVPGYGEAAIADYEAAIATMERLRQELSEKWPVPWRNSLAVAYMNRGNAYQSAAGHGASAAIADYDRAIAMMEELCEQLREEWPLSWRCDLGRAHFNRAQGYLRLGDRPRACCDAVRAENLGLELVRTAGEGPWSELISQASVLRAQACEAQTRPGGSLWERIRALVRLS